MEIWAHTLVKNEERYLWFALGSVIEYVDKVLVWDTGSTDNSIRIVNEFKKRYPNKIDFRQRKIKDANDFTLIRQEMLDQTKADWFLVVDGDEVWWEDSIKKVTDTIRNSKNEQTESIVVPTINLIGDIFHYQEEKAGKYKLAGKKGHLALRGINMNIPGLASKKPHGTWGWVDESGEMIQKRDINKMKFVDAPYMHFTHLVRSEGIDKDKKVIKRQAKYKYEIGKEFPLDYYFPEVFFRAKPDWIASPWNVFSTSYRIKAGIQTPFKKLKRRLISSPSGY